MDRQSQGRTEVAADTHVHLYPEFDVRNWLIAAATNLAAAAGARAAIPARPGVLMLADTPAGRGFARLRHHLGGSTDGWVFRPTDEPDSLLVSHPCGSELCILAGSQIATREGIEVLALTCRSEFRDGESTRSTVQAVLDDGGIPVIPWGFGKWTGRRARVVRETLALFPERLFLGDSGNRPRWFPEPRIFHTDGSSHPVLCGSDPLPLRWHARSPGRYASLLTGHIDRRRPAESVREILRQSTSSPPKLGRRCGLPEFIRSQAQLRMGGGWVSVRDR